MIENSEGIYKSPSNWKRTSTHYTFSVNLMSIKAQIKISSLFIYPNAAHKNTMYGRKGVRL
jgi:hypothetical protein